MLSCIYNGKPFTTSEEGFTRDQKYRLAESRQLICPCCHKPVFYCHEGLKVAHFVHYEVGDCPEGSLRAHDYSNTTKHERLTEVFVDWIRGQFSDIEVIPDYLIHRELKTDIYFELGDTKIAIEIQFKRIPNPSFIKRRELYKKNSIKDIWFFITEEEDYPVGSPFHRTYFHANKRELYFYQANESNCRVFKGFTNEKWEKVGANTLTNYVSVEVPLSNIKIKMNGALSVPELYNQYLLRLKDKRGKDKQRREAEKQKYIPSVGENKHASGGKPENIISKSSPLEDVKQYKNIKQDKALNQDYKEYKFETIDEKEYLNITILYKEKEYKVKYLILIKQVERKEMFLTCRKEEEPENIRFDISINPFLDSIKKVRIQRYELS